MSGERLQAVVRTTVDAIITINSDGIVDSFNPAAENCFGYKAQEVIGKNVKILMEDFHKNHHDGYINQHLATGENKIIGLGRELEGKRKNGSLFPMELAVSKFKDGGDFVFTGIVRDISQRKNLESQLLQAHKETTRVASELTQLIDTANAPIFGIDTQGLVNEWNQEAVSLSGYSKDEVMGHDLVQEFITDEYKESVKQVLDDALRGIETGNYEFPLYTSEGERLEVLLNATSRKNVEGAIVGVIGVGQNITELREKEGALNQMQKLEAVGQLTGGIAHDFNNLLSVIGGNLRFLREDIGTVSTEISELLEDAMSAAGNATELTQQLLTFSKNKVLNPKVINANLIIEKFSRFVSRTLGGKVELVVELAKRDLFLKVDPSQLDNALLNLCINSRDAMPAGGRITISVSQYIKGEFPTSKLLNIGDEKLVKISVKDTGEGIKADDLERVFEPFFTTKEVGKGSGLGLSMVYGFVKQSNGECFVESDYGRSTTVSILLEEVPELIRQNPQKMSSDNLPGETKIILVVEDEPRVRRLTLRDLKKLAYATIEAENADVARATLESGVSVDLVFTDVLMPGKMDGHMLALWVQENFPEVKVVLTSGYNKGKDEVFGNSVEYFPMVRKPYEVRTLAKIIRDELSKKGQGDTNNLTT
ncbi:MAG: PAS domain S-box protein [Betaproteobacteria bacterium]|nr:PAS domain S-box protein [Betaproteobacteria bacterium]